jgi:hypothetical protein
MSQSGIFSTTNTLPARGPVRGQGTAMYNDTVLLLALGVVGFWCWRLDEHLHTTKESILERLDELEKQLKESRKA